nr:uncharacterized protein LOC111418508 [Onthophagus taurus]
MLDGIVQRANQHIEEKSREWEKSVQYQPTNNIELKAVFGLLYLGGVFRNNHRLLRHFWKTDGTDIEVFRITMSQRRFEFLLTCLRFDNKADRACRREIDKLASIRSIVEKFVSNCQNAYTPGQFLTVDEKLEAFVGGCPFRQYMPNMPAKYGIKVHALVDARTYYPFAVNNTPTAIVERHW